MTPHDDQRTSAADCARPAALQFDPETYRSELDQFDITDAQKHELLATLWSIMRSFVDLGFSVDVCAALLDEPVLLSSDGEVG